MKETFATERSECLDRMDRRALRERIAIERQQAVRDISLKRDLASWLDKKLREIEARTGADAQSAALLRNLALKAARRAAAVGGGDDSGDLGHLSTDWDAVVSNSGTLRRAMSEELLSDVGSSVVALDRRLQHRRQREAAVANKEAAAGVGSSAVSGESTSVEVVSDGVGTVYKGLKVSDRPSSSSGGGGWMDENGGVGGGNGDWRGGRADSAAGWHGGQPNRVRYDILTYLVNLKIWYKTYFFNV